MGIIAALMGVWFSHPPFIESSYSKDIKKLKDKITVTVGHNPKMKSSSFEMSSTRNDLSDAELLVYPHPVNEEAVLTFRDRFDWLKKRHDLWNLMRGVPVDSIVVDEPQMDDQHFQLIISPLELTGRARGTIWFVDQQFDVYILDDKGKKVGQAKAQALGEANTSDFIPFSAKIEFVLANPVPVGNDFGTIVLKSSHTRPGHVVERRIDIGFH